MTPKIICVFLLSTACVSAQAPTAQEPGDAMWSKEDEKKLFIAKAAAFEQIGAHLEASFYLEAALSKDGDERRALPRLIKNVLDDFLMPVRRKVEVLIELANKDGGGDDISVILLEVIEEKKWNIFKKKVIS